MAEDVPKTESPGGATPPADPVAPVTPSAPAPGAKDEAKEEGGHKIDPQLVGLALVLWVLAAGIFYFKWDRLQVDWYLGNIKETGDRSGRLDEPSMQALAELAERKPVILAMLAEEITGPLANRDEFYRSAVVKTVERVPGDGALDLLVQATQDYHGVVRANAYVALGARAQRWPAEKARIAGELLRAVGASGDLEPMARAFAISILGDLAEPRALWWSIRGFRDARMLPGSIDVRAQAQGELKLRELSAKAFYQLSGKTREQLPLDHAAEQPVRDEQVRAVERWYQESGHTLPDGEKRLEEAYPATTTPAPQGPSAPAPPPPGPETPPSTEAPR